MRAVDVIRHKRDGERLTPDAIRDFVAGSTSGAWADYQTAALLMAIVLKGMGLDEAVTLTDAMVASGQRLDLREFGGIAVDKHSTGGVGDKLSLVIAPLAAACGAIVPMMSGRGLGHTGGTLDKLESIPGFRTNLPVDEMRAVLRQTGCVMISQTNDVAPADRKLYALRDVTATVESIPLICASILSKKIAEGIGALVLDVKVGSGAFMKTRADARRLASWLVSIAERNGVRTEALLTPMNVPLGRAVGNANEVIESIETLKGRGPRDVEDLSVRLTARMLCLAGIAADDSAAERQVRTALSSGAGLEKFRAIIDAQGGDPRVIDDYSRLPQPAVREPWLAPADGVVTAMDAERVGRAAVALGAGRDRADAGVDGAAGIEIAAPIGTSVKRGDPVVVLACRDAARLPAAMALLADAIRIGGAAADSGPMVIERIDAQSAVAGANEG
jgi:pyrimidine-nucleoside phosphorylase